VTTPELMAVTILVASPAASVVLVAEANVPLTAVQSIIPPAIGLLRSSTKRTRICTEALPGVRLCELPLRMLMVPTPSVVAVALNVVLDPPGVDAVTTYSPAPGPSVNKVDAVPAALVVALMTDKEPPVPVVIAKVIGTPLNAFVETDFGPNEVTPAGGVICTVSGIGSVVDTGPDCPFPVALPSETVTAEARKSCVRLPLNAVARIVAVPAVLPKVSEICASPFVSVKLLAPDKLAGPDNTVQAMVWPAIGKPKPSCSLAISGLLMTEPMTPCWPSPDCLLKVDAGTGLIVWLKSTNLVKSSERAAVIVMVPGFTDVRIIVALPEASVVEEVMLGVAEPTPPDVQLMPNPLTGTPLS